MLQTSYWNCAFNSAPQVVRYQRSILRSGNADRFFIAFTFYLIIRVIGLGVLINNNPVIFLFILKPQGG